MQTATDRIKAISKSLRTFSRADSEDSTLADIHEAIDMFDEIAQEQSSESLKENPQIITIQTSLTERNAVNIQIRDNGKGISETVRSKIFDHLFTTKAAGKGTGLGLAIAHQIITKKHRGSIKVHSEPNQGTEFSICLPLK